jgi:hypothetical protein
MPPRAAICPGVLMHYPASSRASDSRSEFAGTRILSGELDGLFARRQIPTNESAVPRQHRANYETRRGRAEGNLSAADRS